MKSFEVGNVPCGTCRMCCRNELVEVAEGDLGRYETEPHPTLPGTRVLAHGPERECVYLTQTGCSIHGQTPSTCREFDCRVLALRLTRGKAKRLRCERIWEQGRGLLHGC